MNLRTSSSWAGASRLALLGAALLAVAATVVGGAHPAAAEVLPICFPVLDTPVQYYGTFGDPRSGHTHEGEDIMGRKMFRIVSPVDGVVLNNTTRDAQGIRWSGTGHADHSLRMRGDDGHYYAFLHMNNDTPGTDDGLATYDQVFGPGIAPGVRVHAGQLLGYMGDSGNAEGTSPHLHFEIRLPAASVWTATPIDPYDSLQAATRCAPLRSPTHPFTGLGGSSQDDPDIASAREGTFDAFVRGTDGAVWQRSWVGGFTPWLPIGGGLRGGPAAASPAPGRMDVFVRGTDDQLWQRTRIDSTWHAWTPLGGLLRSDPDATSSVPGTLDVTVQGGDGQVWTRHFDGVAWQSWVPLGGGLQGGPAVASPSPGALTVVVRGLDDALWARQSTAGGWGPWHTFGGLLSADPDAAGADGTTHVVVRGVDGRLYHRDTSQPHWAVVSLEATATGAAITSWGGGRLDVVTVSTDDRLYQTWNVGQGW